MKTITNGDEIAALLETLPEGAIIRTSDGVANQLHKYGYGQYQEHLVGKGYWTRTDATYLAEIIPDRLLPATLIYPVIFDAEDVERVARALAEARYDGCPLEDLADIHLAEMLDQARAVLGAVITAYRVDGSSVNVPQATAEDWRTEIANGNTILDLADWYDAQLEQAAYDGPNEQGASERSDDDRMSEMELVCSQTIDTLNESGLEMTDDVAFTLLKAVYDLGRKHRNEENSEKSQRKE